MKKTIALGKIDYNGSGRKNCAVDIEVTLEDGRLSICGNIWNPRRTDCYSCGQNLHTIAEYFPHDSKVKRIIEVWQRWHLNDMKAGTPNQEAWLKDHKAESDAHRLDHYGWACDALAAAGLNPDGDYAYGSAWLKEELPAEVIAEVESW